MRAHAFTSSYALHQPRDIYYDNARTRARTCSASTARPCAGARKNVSGTKQQEQMQRVRKRRRRWAEVDRVHGGTGFGSGAALLPQGRKLYLQCEFGNSSPRHGITGKLGSGRAVPLPPRFPPRTCHRLLHARATKNSISLEGEQGGRRARGQDPVCAKTATGSSNMKQR